MRVGDVTYLHSASIPQNATRAVFHSSKIIPVIIQIFPGIIFSFPVIIFPISDPLIFICKSCTHIWGIGITIKQDIKKMRRPITGKRTFDKNFINPEIKSFQHYFL